jgi:hypothetical protein
MTRTLSFAAAAGLGLLAANAYRRQSPVTAG